MLATLARLDDRGATRLGLSLGPALSELRQVRRRICVVSGVSKINGLKGALAAGLATDLILDEATARRLVDLEGMATSSR